LVADDPKVEMQPCGFVTVTIEGPGSVTETEPGAGRYAHDVGAVFATVGHESYPVVAREPCESRSERKICMHDEYLVCTRLCECLDPGGDRTVQT
jgi:hypothetical protein